MPDTELRKSKISAAVVSVCICLIFLGPMLGKSSSAATFSVNSVFDVNDLTPGNGLCVAYLLISIPIVIPFCTLRAAIEETNALPGEDVILLRAGTYRFNKSGANEDQAFTGDLDITDSVQIVGAGIDQTFIDAAALDRVFDMFGQNVTVSLSGLTITNGSLPTGLADSQKGGGAIRNKSFLFLESIVLENNMVAGTTSEDVGGGLFNEGICSIQKSTINDNRANEGGGIFNGPGSSLMLAESAIIHNSSEAGGGFANQGIATLINSTVSNNSVSKNSYLLGGGIKNWGHLQITQSTIAENSSLDGGGGISNNGTISLVNTLIAGNVGGNCQLAVDQVSQGNNLDSDASCLSFPLQTDLILIDPLLRPLQTNGLYPSLHGLKPGSPAIDAGQSLSEITVDQRGVARPRRKAFDIGAFEAFDIPVASNLAPLLF